MSKFNFQRKAHCNKIVPVCLLVIKLIFNVPILNNFIVNSVSRTNVFLA